MTDWTRVERLRRKGKSWPEIASDSSVGFVADPDTDPGRALKALYLTRKSARAGRRATSDGDSPQPKVTSRIRGRTRGIAVGLAVVGALAVVVLLFLSVTPPHTGVDVVTYCGGEGTAAHYHILLVIEYNGVQQHLPYQPGGSADIGYINQPGYTNPAYYCSSGIHALHTHDGSGIVHAELPDGVSLDPPPTLGNFFQIWGEPLSTNTVWAYSGAVTAQVAFEGSTSAKTDYSSNPGSIPLSVPPEGPLSNPFSIPPAWIFSGAYGDGSSQGLFGGEIIWLNITSGSTAASLGPNHAALPGALSPGPASASPGVRPGATALSPTTASAYSSRESVSRRSSGTVPLG